MSKISEQIREAALGPAPRDCTALCQWLPRKGPTASGGFTVVERYCKHDRWMENYLHGLDEFGARTFLLLVAEALK
jgi:hypothetical protein